MRLFKKKKSSSEARARSVDSAIVITAFSQTKLNRVDMFLASREPSFSFFCWMYAKCTNASLTFQIREDNAALNNRTQAVVIGLFS